MSKFSLIYWLRKTPQPVTVLADAQRIEVPRNGRAWRDLTATIAALEPSKLTCLDGQGNVIRSRVMESATEEGEPANASPEMSDVQLFAKLIAEAYDKAATKMQPIVDSAMAFVERGGQRLAKAESENDRLRHHINKLQQQITELNGASEPAAADPNESIMGAVLAGALQAHAQKPAPVTQLKGGKK